jgi:hypothetical protein
MRWEDEKEKEGHLTLSHSHVYWPLASWFIICEIWVTFLNIFYLKLY